MQVYTPPSLGKLFFSFLRLGATSFGGPAMVAFIRNLAVLKKGWIEEKTFDSGVALCQMIPGATAMQMAAYVGLVLRGLKGAAAAFAGFGLPAFLLMMVLAALYGYSYRLPMVVAAFSGLQAIVVAITANSAFSFGKNHLRGWRPVLITMVAGLMFGLKIHPLIVIAFAAFLGTVMFDKDRYGRPTGVGPEWTSPSPLPFFLILLCAAGAGLAIIFFYNRILFHIALVMLRVDLFAFGGGFAAVPIMLYEVVEARKWLDYQTFMNGIVLGQITPGPILITGTFVGYCVAGLIGGLVATLSVFLPSFSLVIIVAPFFDRLRRSLLFNKAMDGVLCSFVGLLCAVTVRFGFAIRWDFGHGLLAFLAFVALSRKMDIFWVVSAGTLTSLALF